MDKLLNDFSIGLFFTQALILVILIFLMKKFAWKPILNALNEREKGIEEAIEAAAKAKEEMKNLQSQNETLLAEARAERDSMIKDAKVIATKMVDDAKGEAQNEADKIIVSARELMQAEKAGAIAELKSQMATFSIEIAEKVVRAELASDEKQKALAEKLVEDINMN